MTIELAHDVRGDDAAPALVLGSSLGATRAMWDPQHEALADRLRVVRYDHPGHGAVTGSGGGDDTGGPRAVRARAGRPP